MSPEEFKNKMAEIEGEKTIVNPRMNGRREIDYEYRHMKADNLMCDALRDLGYGDGVEIFEGMYKWYA